MLTWFWKMNQDFKSKQVKERWLVFQPTNRQESAINGKWKVVQCDGIIYYSSVQPLSHVQLLPPHELQHVRLPCPSPTPRAGLNSCPSSRWRHPTISSSVIPFSSCLQSFPASGGQSVGALASAPIFPMNIQDWFPLGLTGLISLLYRRVVMGGMRFEREVNARWWRIPSLPSWQRLGKLLHLSEA